MPNELFSKQRSSNSHSPNQVKTSTSIGLMTADLDCDEYSILSRIRRSGIRCLQTDERQWVLEMTKTRHPYWDPLIQEAYLTYGSSKGG